MNKLATGQTVYDPRGTVTLQPFTLAPRPSRLDGLRVGVLDNSKWNASRLLRAIITRLEERYRFGAVTFYKKDSFSRTASDALLARIGADNDVALTAIGD